MGIAQTSGIKKKIIIDKLIENDLIYKLINPKPHDDLSRNELLLGGEWMIDGQIISEQGYIFDYNFIDDTVVDSKVFIFIETDVPIVRNDFAEFNMYISVFADKKLIRFTEVSQPTKQEMKSLGFEGNRIDMLCAVIDNMLNGINVRSVGLLRPASMGYMKIYQPNKQFYGKVLTYTVKSYDDGGDSCEIR